MLVGTEGSAERIGGGYANDALPSKGVHRTAIHVARPHAERAVDEKMGLRGAIITNEPFEVCSLA